MRIQSIPGRIFRPPLAKNRPGDEAIQNCIWIFVHSWLGCYMLGREETEFCSCSPHLIVESISSPFEHYRLVRTSCGWSFTELDTGVQSNGSVRDLYYSTKATSSHTY